ncbi:hypothetical protein [Evansella cellulosilytica]|uniref:Uncharacterized protein n=1 Tax=Evansella cellulosilytica (strain ATCC 21833 / DSM 2522 / FERM P-1141 / JCM 9156 / N-4) TaxID=649639 RepID=E6TVL7_EVAC2|nr:hypothetical protein [Evansella cellulosilytica]ADU32145.1 hypothetical protein Bcell_3909 [Evansella cellulosilytica DSM 2522]
MRTTYISILAIILLSSVLLGCSQSSAGQGDKRPDDVREELWYQMSDYIIAVNHYFEFAIPHSREGNFIFNSEDEDAITIFFNVDYPRFQMDFN